MMAVEIMMVKILMTNYLTVLAVGNFRSHKPNSATEATLKNEDEGRGWFAIMRIVCDHNDFKDR